MAFSTDDFNKIWASTSPLTPYEFSENNYKQGWDFVGGTPPSRQMWDYLQKLTDEKIKYIYNNMIPVGIVQAFAGATTPDGWLLCDGSAVSRTDYATLYAVIGDTYGAGNGSSTFNLPNLTDKFIQGSATAGTVKSAGLPNIEGRVVFHGGEAPSVISRSPDSANALYGEGGSGTQYRTVLDLTVRNGAGSYGEIHFSASRHNSVYGNSTTVQPPSVTMRYIIKY